MNKVSDAVDDLLLSFQVGLELCVSVHNYICLVDCPATPFLVPFVQLLQIIQIHFSLLMPASFSDSLQTSLGVGP
jgi:hypothetical protein